MNSKKCVVKPGVKKINALCIDVTKIKDGAKDRIFNESKNTYIECIPESETFQFFKCCFQLKTDKN